MRFASICDLHHCCWPERLHATICLGQELLASPSHCMAAVIEGSRSPCRTIIHVLIDLCNFRRSAMGDDRISCARAAAEWSYILEAERARRAGLLARFCDDVAGGARGHVEIAGQRRRQVEGSVRWRPADGVRGLGAWVLGGGLCG